MVSGCLVLKTPYGENHLQKYDLYQNKHTSQLTKNILILLSYSDGKTSIIEIANKFNIDSFEIVNAVEAILKNKIAKLKYY